jgi:hypothetical protein
VRCSACVLTCIPSKRGGFALLSDECNSCSRDFGHLYVLGKFQIQISVDPVNKSDSVLPGGTIVFPLSFRATPLGIRKTTLQSAKRNTSPSRIGTFPVKEA